MKVFQVGKIPFKLKVFDCVANYSLTFEMHVPVNTFHSLLSSYVNMKRLIQTLVEICLKLLSKINYVDENVTVTY